VREGGCVRGGACVGRVALHVCVWVSDVALRAGMGVCAPGAGARRAQRAAWERVCAAGVACSSAPAKHASRTALRACENERWRAAQKRPTGQPLPPLRVWCRTSSMYSTASGPCRKCASSSRAPPQRVSA
jgi:hypothetical protein